MIERRVAWEFLSLFTNTKRNDATRLSKKKLFVINENVAGFSRSNHIFGQHKFPATGTLLLRTLADTSDRFQCKENAASTKAP